MKIRTEFVYPPIPIRSFDWSAVDDDTYEGGCPIGYGPTEQAAIEDLKAQLEEEDGYQAAVAEEILQPLRKVPSLPDTF